MTQYLHAKYKIYFFMYHGLLSEFNQRRFSVQRAPFNMQPSAHYTCKGPVFESMLPE